LTAVEHINYEYSLMSVPSAAAEPLTLLLLSDIHFGKLTAFPQHTCGIPVAHAIKDAVPMKPHLVHTLKSLGLAPDAILVLGDLTSIASPSEFQGSEKFVRSIAAEIGIDQKMVFFTFGNHDVDWRVSSLGKETPGFSKDSAYEHVASSMGSLFVANPPKLMPGPLSGSGVFANERFTLFVANSGYYCVSEQDYRHGKLGHEQMVWLERAFTDHADDSKWRMLMIHHHPFNYPYPTLTGDISTLEEGADLLAMTGKHGIDFVCHGHRHHPKLKTTFENSWKRPVTFFCAGSFGVKESERNHGQIPNLFHIVRLETRLPNGALFGHIRSFEYAASEGWRAIRNTKETPLDAVQWFGALVTDAELEDHARNFLSFYISSLSDQQHASVMLAGYDQLPPELRCQPLHGLNLLLKDIAGTLNCKVLGKYPDEVAIRKK
jgi:hypothetical protein